MVRVSFSDGLTAAYSTFEYASRVARKFARSADLNSATIRDMRGRVLLDVRADCSEFTPPALATQPRKARSSVIPPVRSTQTGSSRLTLACAAFVARSEPALRSVPRSALAASAPTRIGSDGLPQAQSSVGLASTFTRRELDDLVAGETPETSMAMAFRVAREGAIAGTRLA